MPTIRALNLYYAREPALREQVLATRLRASEVRAAIGIARGRIFRRIEGVADLPDVMWDCPFPDVAGHDRDMDARAASAEFEAVRAHMRSMLRRFGRVLYDVTHAGSDVAPSAPGARLMQLWLENPSAVPIPDAAPQSLVAGNPAAAMISVLRRHGSDLTLPQWIVELPAAGHEEIACSIQGAYAAIPEVSARCCTWERCA